MATATKTSLKSEVALLQTLLRLLPRVRFSSPNVGSFFFRELNSVKDCIEVNPLSPGIHIEILQTDLHTFP